VWYFIVGAPVPDLPEFDEFGNPNVKAIRAHMKRRYGLPRMGSSSCFRWRRCGSISF
jgi:hypothetical protein